VEPGSQADELGLRAGQRIVDVRITRIAKDGMKSKEQDEPTVKQANGLLIEADGRHFHSVALRTSAGPPVASWTVDSAELTSAVPVHPTQLYEAFGAGIMALFAWLYFPFRRRDGEVFALMLTIFPISRFLMEWVRTDEPANFLWGITISQTISIGLFLSSFAFWWWVLRKPAGSQLTPADWQPYNLHWAEAA
jgi:phosphatidylglycerol:prolipoprotein diacylglycerol transferase